MLAGTLVDDLELRVSASSPSDDLQLTRAQMVYWLSVVRDSLVKEYLDSLIKAGKPIESIYVERYMTAQAIEETNVKLDDDEERLYITLPYQPMTLFKDQGVIKVVTDEGAIVLRSRLEDIEVLTDLRYASPTPSNMIWYRENKNVIITGLYWKNKDSTDFTVSYIPTYTSKNLDESATFIINDELIPELMNRCEEIAKRELYGSQTDLENDAIDPKMMKNAQPNSAR